MPHAMVTMCAQLAVIKCLTCRPGLEPGHRRCLTRVLTVQASVPERTSPCHRFTLPRLDLFLHLSRPSSPHPLQTVTAPSPILHFNHHTGRIYRIALPAAYAPLLCSIATLQNRFWGHDSLIFWALGSKRSNFLCAAEAGQMKHPLLSFQPFVSIDRTERILSAE